MAMKIDLNNIDKGENLNFEFETKAEELEVPEVKLRQPVSVMGQLTKFNGDLTLKGEIVTSLEVSCSRCLREFEHHLRMHFDWGARKGSGADSGAENVLLYKDSYIDITDDVRQMIVLNLPVKPLCREDCKGLCPQCGKDFNHDRCGCKPGRPTASGKLKKILVKGGESG